MHEDQRGLYGPKYTSQAAEWEGSSRRMIAAGGTSGSPVTPDVINGQCSLALTVPTLFLSKVPSPAHVICNLGSFFNFFTSPFSTLVYLYISLLNIQY
ncbi:hypothetical protein ACN38_g10706 [Penicillium nordicum]|uniref:Uncharacterized protein n=1 Tax=Penicillium nordicum TaxID=229535 RepID=A0A0M8NTJ6_9EURO|nr:hypothetical protein ACN38_g10706 [Penicillium nordicum]